MNARLKEIIFKKLYRDLSKVEIISYKDEIWFIDRETKYWYLIYGKSGTLYWRYNFFEKFFFMFSMYNRKYEPLISEWVEEVLNCKINATQSAWFIKPCGVEEVLNCKVNATGNVSQACAFQVEEVLNCKVNAIFGAGQPVPRKVEEVLNCKVDSIDYGWMERSGQCGRGSELQNNLILLYLCNI